MNDWPIYVINMAANTTRMTRVTDELARRGLSFDRFEAVDGRALTEAERARVYDPQANARRARHPMIGPELGCYLSHVALWEKIAQGPAGGAVILEDDFAAQDDLPQVIKALAADGGDWDIAKLFSLKQAQGVMARRPLSAGREIVTPYKVPTTTLGYAIRRKAAARLAARALPVSRPIDEDHKHFWELDLRVALVMPPPLRFGDETAETGSIQSARRRARGLQGWAALAQGWRSLRYRLRYVAGLHWHRLVRRVR
ncbi:glycosyltransferase family 25 protein [Roseicyclus mahoneyensis]|uniref:Glycosyl transferase family 25 n=1 Tax=Roseicyclus mahoneyensis TaxID=164332 RepID=A0A316GFE4_9RHOB|nr:glycosyltransferase family 25 protein [Roseicyclus mahoneyensis]PWK59641.1 glycosyl transferase family 25 [Roseicyclus mahoneyensis]